MGYSKVKGKVTVNGIVLVAILILLDTNMMEEALLAVSYMIDPHFLVLITVLVLEDTSVPLTQLAPKLF